MRNSGTIFMGLFLMVFALYAIELKKNKQEIPSTELTTIIQNQPVSDLNTLHEKALTSDIFRNRIDGLSIEPPEGPLDQDHFVVTLSGEDVYSSGETEIGESWNGVLDWFGEFLLSDPCLRLEVRAYSDESDLKEKAKADQGSGMIALSSSRGEWFRQRLLRKHGKVIEDRILEIKGMGPKNQGKEIEFEFSCYRS